MKIEPIKQKTAKVQKNANDFMKDSGHQDHAQLLVKRDVGELKEMGFTKEEVVEKMAKKGFLKTETDRKILEGEIRKVKENPERYRENKQKEIKHQRLVEGFIRQSQQSQQNRPKPIKRYF